MSIPVDFFYSSPGDRFSLVFPAYHVICTLEGFSARSEGYIFHFLFHEGAENFDYLVFYPDDKCSVVFRDKLIPCILRGYTTTSAGCTLHLQYDNSVDLYKEEVFNNVEQA